MHNKDCTMTNEFRIKPCLLPRLTVCGQSAESEQSIDIHSIAISSPDPARCEMEVDHASSFSCSAAHQLFPLVYRHVLCGHYRMAIGARDLRMVREIVWVGRLLSVNVLVDCVDSMHLFGYRRERHLRLEHMQCWRCGTRRPRSVHTVCSVVDRGLSFTIRQW